MWRKGWTSETQLHILIKERMFLMKTSQFVFFDLSFRISYFNEDLGHTGLICHNTYTCYNSGIAF